MAVLIGIFVGLVLGLTGAGGSVFAVPLLIILLKLPVTQAIGFSLGAVALTSFYGMISHWRCKTVLWIPALILSFTSAVTSPLGNLLGQKIAPSIVMAGFSGLAIIIAVRMWIQAKKDTGDDALVRSGLHANDIDIHELPGPACRLNPAGRFEWRLRCIGGLAGGGLLTGLLTGLFGVGGGFLIVPLLLYLSQVTMVQAVGTSLFIITIASSSGFFTYLTSATSVDWGLLGQLAAGGFCGMFAGQIMGTKLPGTQLQRIFSVSLLSVATMMLLFLI